MRRSIAHVLLAILASACGAKTTSVDGDAGSDAVTDAPLDGRTVVPDPCGGQTAVCPVAGAIARGSGLHPIDRCAFPMTDGATWASRSALVDALPPEVARVTLADIALDLNRAADTVTAAEVPGTAPGIKAAFKWQAGDESVAYWIPQGITGSFDATADGLVAGRKLLLVSWYYDQAQDTGSTVDKGVRLAIADVTNPAAVAYRLVLLVDPIADPDNGGRTDFTAVHVHAGGLAWIGDYLYVPVTGSGFRVFDLANILRMPTTADLIGYDAATASYNAHGYKYAVPQVGEYTTASPCTPIYSFVSLDRTSSPASLITGEYDAASVTGRLYRWPLDAWGRLVETDANRVVPDAAWFLAESHVQGALANAGTMFLSSSQPAGTAGALYRTQEGTPSATIGWIDSPEDLAYDPQTDRIWGLSEAATARFVVAVAHNSVK